MRVKHSEEELLKQIKTLRSTIAELEAQSARISDESPLRSFRIAVETMQLGVTITDVEGKIVYTNDAEARMHGYAVEEMIGQGVRLMAPKESWKPLTLEQMKEMKRWKRESINVRKDGTTFSVMLRSDVVMGANAQPLGIITTCEDITQRKHAEWELEHSLSLLRATLESTADGLLVVDHAGKIITYYRKFQQMWRLPDSILQQADDNETLAFVLNQLKDPDTFLQKVRDLYARPEAESFDELEFSDGRFFERFSVPQRIGEDCVGRVWSFRDVTERKHAEIRLQHDAFHDVLTGLPNRALFMDRLGQVTLKRRRYYLFAILFLDLDRFKVINDSLGHMVGDQLLIATARKLDSCLRPGDTVARLGGDEFAILLDDIKDISDATRVAERIQIELKLPFDLNGQEIFTTASIGITLGATGFDSPEDLLRDADTAMYRAKTLGKARHEVFDKEMHSRAVALLRLETDLRKAVEHIHFRIHYQPIVSLESGMITGFEALVRWQHPERGLVFPTEFIPMAEETGLIIPIGRWVLREACRQMHSWQVQFPEFEHLSISVNLSGKQFTQRDLVQQVSGILEETGLNPSSLRLEITESVLMQNADSAAAMLTKLKLLNIQVYIDDFGTGYSSFSYLHRFPFDTLKIDRSFVSRMGGASENSEIVRAMVTLAQNLGKDVIAEGIETVRQLSLLREMNCHRGQGYHFSHPVDHRTAEQLILSRPRW